MDDERNLEKLRYDSLLKITRTMGGAALSGAVPPPTLELAKQLGISIADAWMCFDIYKTYFENDLTKRDLSKMLQTTGVVILGHHRHRLRQLDLHHRARLAGDRRTELLRAERR